MSEKRKITFKKYVNLRSIVEEHLDDFITEYENAIRINSEAVGDVYNEYTSCIVTSILTELDIEKEK